MEKYRKKSVKYQKRPDYGKVEINFSDKALFEKFKQMGFPVGLKGDIFIPRVFPKKVWPRLIAGIFATDGSLALVNNNGLLYPRVEFRSNSSKLVKQVQGFLRTLGIVGNLYCIPNGRGYKPTYRLEIPGKNNLFKFNDLIGFINPKQQRRLEEYLEMIHSR